MTFATAIQTGCKEAQWTFGLTILYVIGWCVCAYLPENTAGPLGFPL